MGVVMGAVDKDLGGGENPVVAALRIDFKHSQSDPNIGPYSWWTTTFHGFRAIPFSLDQLRELRLEKVFLPLRVWTEKEAKQAGNRA